MSYICKGFIMRKQTLEKRIVYRIKRSSSNVFLRHDFADLGGYDQVGRVLRRLVSNNILIKIGYGVYVRSKVSSLSGNFILSSPLPELAKEALKKLRIETVETDAERAYNSRNSTQVPSGQQIGVRNSRVCRKIGFNGKIISYDRYIA